MLTLLLIMLRCSDARSVCRCFGSGRHVPADVRRRERCCGERRSSGRHQLHWYSALVRAWKSRDTARKGTMILRSLPYLVFALSIIILVTYYKWRLLNSCLCLLNARNVNSMFQALETIPREKYYLATKVGRYEANYPQMFDFRYMYVTVTGSVWPCSNFCMVLYVVSSTWICGNIYMTL